MSRTICIGDVHGCLSLLEQLLDRFNFDPSSDHLVFIGDLIDQGPKPVTVVRLVRTLTLMGRATVIQGNHEQKAVTWLRRRDEERSGGRVSNMRGPSPGRRDEWEELTLDERKWIEELPLYKEVLPGWIAIHAGFEGVPMAEQRQDKLCRVIAVDERTGRMKPTGPNGEILPGTVEWMSRWHGPQSIVYGHKVHGLGLPRVDHPAPGIEVWGIDTGACYGGNLTAFVLETKEVFQVSDGVAYAKWRHPGEKYTGGSDD